MDTTLYELVMKAAIEFQNEDLAKKVWNDRGKFRTTVPFLKMDQRIRIAKDQKFAHLMVEFFTKQGKYSDAIAIILSSKNRFNWTYSSLGDEVVAPQARRSRIVLRSHVDHGLIV